MDSHKPPVSFGQEIRLTVEDRLEEDLKQQLLRDSICADTTN